MTEDGDGRDVEDVVAAMTLEEKVSRVHGVGFAETPENVAGYVPGIERLDVPPVTMVDGPGGLNVDTRPGTDVPHPVVAASTFDPGLARELGATIARETAAIDRDVLLVPTADLFRFPLQSRAAETLGEDPRLAAEVATAYASGVASVGVVPTAKHYTCYNQSDTPATPDDQEPSNHDVRVSERALRELYLRPFEALVDDGAVGGFMAAYNRVNGSYGSANEHLLRDVLKGEWGFDGFVVSDWLGTHSTVGAAEGGLDVEMPAGEYFGDALRDAVEDGDVSEATVDEMVRRVLWAIDRAEGSDATGAIATDEHFETAERVAREGSVLLENEGVLPLDPDALDTVAVVGLTPDEYRSGVGGSDTAEPVREVGPAEGIDRVFGDGVTVDAVSADEYRVVGPDSVTPGGDIGADTGPDSDAADIGADTGPDSDAADTGFTAEFFTDGDCDGEPVHTRVEGTIDRDEADVAEAPGVGPHEIGTRWSGTLTAPATGSYGFRLTSGGSATLEVDGEAVAESEASFFGPVAETGRVELEAGESCEVVVEASGAVARLEWNRPDVDWFGRAVAAASDADAAVVVVRSDTDYGTDRREFALPGRQDELVEAVAAGNDETVVLANTESPVAMPWVDEVPGIFQVWFPGQEGGTAIADLLAGNADPSGRLPVTYGATLADYPPDQPEGYPGVDGEIEYTEGVFLGYRGFDAEGSDPLFPFGHGESYTEFAYGDLELSAESVEPGGSVDVSVTVENTGDREGAEVVQVYVADPVASVDRPPKELAGFEKVWLAPGETREVTCEVTADDLAFYHPEDGWTVEPGRFEVSVGRSSRDLRLDDSFELVE